LLPGKDKSVVGDYRPSAATMRGASVMEAKLHQPGTVRGGEVRELNQEDD